ncbi:bifunctional phosphatase PAP2/diacylglycerol kinase family protein [Rhodococcus sp. X156]|uniref:bifunctional phosphatase PAP2/diacylglycerol kinase family protein n=1 Tax=Rhodococcus sp. X156 TaxID=2499145 RepID=UPI000FD9C23C|nr:bifunctional phosphatase PAP2/diacylglycerol kinase family protein [Rhodococcus sp. X156]
MSRLRRRVLGTASQLATADHALIGRSARLRPSPMDRTLLGLSRSANHSVLWCGLAAGMLVAGGRPRRGAVRGLLAVAGASAVANGMLKPVFPRRRPPAQTVPALRRLVHPPTSSSFPSGHSASAAAFVTAVALESPASGALLAPLAGAVAYSRVHVGVHWPSDVLVGAGVGAAVALATRRWWAVRPEEPAVLGARVQAPALADGEGLLVLTNPASGNGDDPATELVELLPRVRLLETDPDRDAGEQLQEAVDAGGVRALAVSGGDGTVQAVAGVAVANGLPMAVLPGGTLNHFARDVDAVDVAATASAIAAGRAERVDSAEVCVDAGPGRLFVNTASIGGYPDAVQLREQLEHRIGKWPAAAVAMVRVLQRAAPLEVELDGRRAALWMLFVGNGRYAPTDQVPMSRPTLSSATLDVRYLRADTYASRTRLLLAAATGTLAGSPTYVHSNVEQLRVQVLGPPTSLATDGEVAGHGRTFTFRSRPQSLVLYRA